MGFGGLGPWEILLIFLVVLLLFGAKRLPEIGSSLGKGIREFKGSLKEIENEMKGPADPPRRSPNLTVSQSGSDGAVEGEPRRLASTPVPDSAPVTPAPEAAPQEAETPAPPEIESTRPNHD